MSKNTNFAEIERKLAQALRTGVLPDKNDDKRVHRPDFSWPGFEVRLSCRKVGVGGRAQTITKYYKTMNLFEAELRAQQEARHEGWNDIVIL